MKFGKLADISAVDFVLPPDAAATTRILPNLPSSTLAPTAYIGCTGWSMKEWLGKVYPQKAKSKDYLEHYAQQFNTIELNTTHYRIPTAETIATWKRTVPTDFRFCPKIPQSISHSRDMGIANGRVLAFCEAVQGLETVLGHCFMQLPPYFGFEKLGILKHFLTIFPSHIPLAVEIRHESWFNTPKALDAFFQLLERFRATAVITDVAGRRDVLHQGITTETTMIRFVGNNLHASDYHRIDAWVERLDAWFQKGLKTVYFFTHEPDNILAPELADYLVSKLKELPYLSLRGPKFIEDEQDKQMSLF